MKIQPSSALPGPVCLALFLPLLALNGAAPKQSPRQPDNPPLTAQLTVEPPELSPASTVEVIFPTPMIARERVGSVEQDPILQINPPLTGTFEWASSRSGIFRLAQTPAFNTPYEFRLRPNLRDLEGKPLSSAALATVRSAPFRLIDQHPKWFSSEEARRSPKFLFEFNDAVTPAEAAASFTFVSDDPPLTVPATVRHATRDDFYGEPQPTWAEEIAKIKPAATPDAPRQSALVVEPQTPLPVAKGWKLQVAATLRNASGRDALAQRDVLKLGQVSAFEVTGVQGHTPFDAPYYLEVGFNKSLLPPGKDGSADDEEADPKTPKEMVQRLAAKLAAAVRIEPPVAGVAASIENWNLRLTGPFALGVPYQIVIEPEIASGDGLALEAATRAAVTFKPNPPYVAAPAFMRAQLAKGAGEFEFAAANVREVRVRVKRLNGAELLQAAEKYEAYRSAYNREDSHKEQFKPVRIDDYNGTLIFDRVFPISKPLDQSEVVKLNWREVLGAAAATPLFVDLEGTSAEGTGHAAVVTQTLVQFTDLGMIQKSNDRETLIFVTSLQTGQPVPGARLTLVNDQHKLIGYGDTGADGIAVIRGDSPTFVLGEKDGDCAVIQCRDSHVGNLIPYDIPLAWRNVWKPLRRTFIFSDRPVYRPGETGHFKAHSRLLTGDDLTMDAKPLKARLKLRDPRYRVVLDREVTFTATGSWDGNLVLPEGPTGWYQMSLTVDAAQNDDDEDGSGNQTHSFRIDDYKPNTFEVQIETARVEILTDRLKLPVSARYYMGKPLSRAKVNWHASALPEFTPPEAYAGFHFGDSPRWASYGKDDPSAYDEEAGPDAGEWWVNGDIAVNEEGTAVLEMPAPPPHRASLPQQVRVVAEVTDINQQTISSAATFEIPGAAFVVGLKGPQLFGTAGEPVMLDMVAIQPDGRPAAGAVRVNAKIERQEFHTLRVATAGGGSTTKEQVVLKEEWQQAVDLQRSAADRPPSAIIRFAPKRGGMYFLTAESTDPSGKKGLSRLPFYVIGSGEFPWAMEDGARISLQADKSTLKPGEEAVIVVKTPIAGTALVSVERNRIHRHFIAQISPDNPAVRVPVQDAEAPNVFVSVVVFRGSDASPKTHKMPEYRVGYCQLEIESSTKELRVAVSADKAEVKPGEAIAVTAIVTDHEKQPVPGSEVTVYAVDEGVLSLMQHETPDPAAFFHQPFGLAIDNFTSLGDLLSEDSAARHRGNKGFLIGGGGEEMDPAPMKVRKNFVATPLWVAAAVTDAAGKVSANFNAPDNLTRYRLMAVAASGADRFGSGEGDVTINKPLMVEPVVPRFARLGDEVLLKAVVHNTTPHEGQVEVALELDGTAAFIREPRFFVPASLTMDAGADANPRITRQIVAVKAGETTSAVFPVRFERLGEAAWQWTARTVQWTAGAPALNDATESKFNVAHPLPELRDVRYARIKKGAPAENLLGSVNPALLEGEGTLQVHVSASRLGELRDAVSYLL